MAEAQSVDFDDDNLSDFSIDSAENDDIDFHLDDDTSATTGNAVWQNLPPPQFSKRPYSGHDSNETHFGIYREVGILDHAVHDVKNPWIRLLRIAPAKYGQPIHCDLVRRPLWDAGRYIALSYSWGRYGLSQRIYIGSREPFANDFPVSEHLWKAIQRLRHEQRAVNVWIDAICIDQHNDLEKAAQVTIMAQIFNQASEVRVWLGEESTIDYGNITDVGLFRSLCQGQAPWWKRLWILQECGYAQECPVVMIGNRLINLDHFVERWCSAADVESESLNPGDIALLSANLEFLRTPLSIWATQNTNGNHRLPLSQRLQQTAGRQCTDPHDMIYALLGLIDENEAKELQPDYSKPFLTLLEEVTVILTQSWSPNEESKALPDARMDLDYPPEKHRDGASMADTRTHEKMDINALIKSLRRQRYALDASAELIKACTERDEQAVERMIDLGADVNAKNDSGSDALQEASAKGSEKKVILLLSHGANVNAQGGFYGSALQAASRNGHKEVVKTLLIHNANVNAQGGFYGSALQAASERGYWEIATILLRHGADVNAQGGTHGNALQAASDQGHASLVDVLLTFGADMHGLGGQYGNALQSASYRGHGDIVRMLLDEGADVNAQGGKYGHALQAASKKGHKKVAELLIDRGADINAQGGEYGNALQAACCSGHRDIVEMLIRRGADIHAGSGRYHTALEAALLHGHYDVAKIIKVEGNESLPVGTSMNPY